MEFEFDESFNPIRARYPHFVFGYLRADDRLLSSLRESYLWFSSPQAFNDPFDCRDIFEADNTVEELRWYLSKYAAGKFSNGLEISKIVEIALDNIEILQEGTRRLYQAKLAQVGV